MPPLIINTKKCIVVQCADISLLHNDRKGQENTSEYKKSLSEQRLVTS